MKLIMTDKLIMLMLVLSACQVTTFSNISDGVREAITYEDSSKKRVVSRTTEMLDARTGKWFEAKRIANGKYILTLSGKAARREMLANEASASGGY